LPLASCLLPLASCLLPLASCLLPLASCLLPLASCLLSFASLTYLLAFLSHWAGRGLGHFTRHRETAMGSRLERDRILRAGTPPILGVLLQSEVGGETKAIVMTF
jgi:hypothetical protein